MRQSKRLAGSAGIIGAVAAAAVPIALAGGVASASAVAPALSHRTFVSPHGKPGHGDFSCATAAFSSIQAAVNATAPRGQVIICRGSYRQDVTVTKRLTLIGYRGAEIDAKGRPYGVGLAHSYSAVVGLTVKNATVNTKAGWPGDGILTAGFVAGKPVASNHDVIRHDITLLNQGAGIDLNSTSWSVAASNTSIRNGVGINLSNDLGKPDAHNIVRYNNASYNPGGCGVALADHTGAGVFRNLITRNVLDGNGLGTPSRPNASAGSGVILAAAGTKGGVWDNVISENRMSGNGHGGVAMHVHMKGPKFYGNRVVRNSIGRNNLRTDYADRATTGIYLGSAGLSSITVKYNLITNNRIGIFAAGRVVVRDWRLNAFRHVRRHLVRYPKFQ